METCKTCRGEKVLPKEVELNLENLYTIVENGRTLKRGYGHQSRYYKNKVGSLIINISYVENKIYKRDRNDIHYTLNLHYEDAISGKKHNYKHLDDKEFIINISKKSKDGDTVRLKNKGFLIDGTNRGDLYIKFNIIVDYDRI